MNGCRTRQAYRAVRGPTGTEWARQYPAFDETPNRLVSAIFAERGTVNLVDEADIDALDVR